MNEPAGVFTEDEANKAVQLLISQLFYVIERLTAQVKPVSSVERAQYTALRVRAVRAVQESNLPQLASLTGELSGMSLHE
jgi:hypothetical protein